MAAFFDLLFSVPDLPPLLFSWLDSSSLALAACVCRGWRDTARKVRGSNKLLFRLALADLVHVVPLLAWVAANLNKKRIPTTLQAEVCNITARKGALAALQWARKNNFPWAAWTCAFAARGGHLALLQWARKNGCPWDFETCHNAAGGGHLEILRWARDNGCEWNDRTCAYAAQGGHREKIHVVNLPAVGPKKWLPLELRDLRLCGVRRPAHRPTMGQKEWL